MAKAKAFKVTTSRSLTGWRRALVFVLLVAFALQGYVVQTHIHFAADAPLALGSASHDAKAAVGGHHDKFPPGEDPANCPICQEILHTGQFVTPATLSVLPPAVAVSTIVFVDAARPFISVASHSWRGRAPPHS
jgi:hypothetical protein